MKRRLHDCEIWKKKWFRKLAPEYKCFVIYLFDNCTNAGIWDVDTDLAEFHICPNCDLSQPSEFLPEDFQIIKIKEDKWFIPKFLKFHYPNGLGSHKPAVIGVRKELEYHNIMQDTLEIFGKEYFEYQKPPEPESEPKEPKKVSEEGLKFAAWFGTLLPSLLNKKIKYKSWAECYDKMLKLDKRTKKEITKICEWARNDEFWADNFLTPLKLRNLNKDKVRYYDVFLIKMNSDLQKPNGGMK